MLMKVVNMCTAVKLCSAVAVKCVLQTAVMVGGWQTSWLDVAADWLRAGAGTRELNQSISICVCVWVSVRNWYTNFTSAALYFRIRDLPSSRYSDVSLVSWTAAQSELPDWQHHHYCKVIVMFTIPTPSTDEKDLFWNKIMFSLLCYFIMLRSASHRRMLRVRTEVSLVGTEVRGEKDCQESCFFFIHIRQSIFWFAICPVKYNT